MWNKILKSKEKIASNAPPHGETGERVRRENREGDICTMQEGERYEYVGGERGREMYTHSQGDI